MKQNCWDLTNCGKYISSANLDDLDVDSETIKYIFDVKNGAQAAGYFCWMPAIASYGNSANGIFAERIMNCAECEIFLMLKRNI